RQHVEFDHRGKWRKQFPDILFILGASKETIMTSRLAIILSALVILSLPFSVSGQITTTSSLPSDDSSPRPVKPLAGGKAAKKLPKLKTPEEYFQRASEFYQDGEFDSAISDYEEAIRRRSSYAEAYLELANVYSSKGDKERAISGYKEAIRVK